MKERNIEMSETNTGEMTKRAAYVYFIICIVLEQIAIVFLNYCEGFTVLVPSIICLVSIGLCYAFFGKCLKVINLAVGFAVWSGVAVIWTAVLSLTVLHYHLNAGDIVGLVLVITGIVGMNLKA